MIRSVVEDYIDDRVFETLAWVSVDSLLLGMAVYAIFFAVFPVLAAWGYIHRTFIGVSAGYTNVPRWSGLWNLFARGIGLSIFLMILLVLPMIVAYIPIAYSTTAGVAVLFIAYILELYLTPAALFNYNQQVFSRKSFTVPIQTSYFKGAIISFSVFLVYVGFVLAIYGVQSVAMQYLTQYPLYLTLGMLYLVWSLLTYLITVVIAVVFGVYTTKAYQEAGIMNNGSEKSNGKIPDSI